MGLWQVSVKKKMFGVGTNSRGSRAKFCHIANSALRAQARRVAIEVRRCGSVFSRAFDCAIYCGLMMPTYIYRTVYIYIYIFFFGGEQVTDQADC